MYNPQTDDRLECKYKRIAALKAQANDLEWEGYWCRADRLREEITRLEASNDDFIARF